MMPRNDRELVLLVLDEVLGERERQHARWGEQNHPDGTGWLMDVTGECVRTELADQARAACQRADAAGALTWAHILEEEFHEAMACGDTSELRAELIQVAAVAVAWVEAIDRREADRG